MKLEEQVCSLELAMQLKELGVKQDSLFFYIQRKNEKNFKLANNREIKGFEFFYDNIFSAFTVAELGEMLPKECVYQKINYIKYNGEIRNGWEVKSINNNNLTCIAETEANVRANILIHLIENNEIKLEDINE